MNTPGCRPNFAIIASRANNGKWVVAAYGEDSLVLESVVEDEKDKALMNLAGKLLARLWRVSRVIDKTKGGISFRSVDDCYVIDDPGA